MSRSQKDLLRLYGIQPVKRRGQHFLLDGNLARWLAHRTLELGSDVLELGAGAGALTAPLLAMGARVTAVEVDRRLCALLAQEYGQNPNMTVVGADLAQLDWRVQLLATGVRPVVAGNLPYVMTSTVLFALADQRERLAGAVLMVQKEVAGRLTAVAGSKEYGVLAVLLGSLFTIEVIRQVPAAVFWPRPEVASAVVRLVPAASWRESEYRDFRQVVKTLFGKRRKQVGTLLREEYGMSAGALSDLARTTGVDLVARPEQLPAEQLRSLARDLSRRGRT